MRLFRDLTRMSSGVFAALVIASLRSVLVLRILGPDLMGAWKTALLADSFSEFPRLGVSRAMGMQVPLWSGRGDEDESQRVIATTSAYMTWLGLALCTLTFALSCFVKAQPLKVALRCVALFVGLEQPVTFLRDLAAGRHLFLVRAKENVLHAAADLICAVGLSVLFGLAGLGVATIIALIVTLFYLQARQGTRFYLRLDLRRLGNLVRLGSPLSLCEASFDFARRLDIIMLAFVLGTTAVGYYGVTVLIMEFSMILAQKGVSQVLSSHLMHEYGRTGSFLDVAMFYEMPVKFFSYLLPPLLGVGSLFIGHFVRVALPQYAPGIPAAEILIWALFFVALHSSMSSFFVAAGWVSTVLRLYAVAIAVGIAAQYIVLKAGMGLIGAAGVSTGTLALISCGEIYLAQRRCGRSGAESAQFVLLLQFPLLAAVALKLLVDSFSFSLHSPQVTDCAKALMFLFFYVPVLAGYESRFCILRAVRQTM